MSAPKFTPGYTVIDIYPDEARTVNGVVHSTYRKKGEIKVLKPDGTPLLSMSSTDQPNLDLAWEIARFLSSKDGGRLIAAAPELYEALKNALLNMKDAQANGIGQGGAIARAEAALSKVEGRIYSGPKDL